MEKDAQNKLHETNKRIEELTDITVRLDQLVETILTSRRWKIGNIISDLIISTTPQFVRKNTLLIVRLLIKFLRIRRGQSHSQINHDYRLLHESLSQLLHKPDFDTQYNAYHDNEKSSSLEIITQNKKVSVVSVLYNSAATIELFIHALVNQNYEGDIEIVLIDDNSRDNSYSKAIKISKELDPESGASIVVEKNKKNIGNCRARNRGVSIATGDIFVIIDSDCIVNEGFVAAHAFEHANDYDVCIGPMGLEATPDTVENFIAELEANRDLISSKMRLQYSPVPTLCVNCVTRNFSISRPILDRLGRSLFDESFTYRNAPDTGFGWEDVEMGTALFQIGASITFAWGALSVHLQHPPSVDDKTKAFGSKRNFEKLLQKHPRLYSIAPTWLKITSGKIHNWIHKYDPSDPGLQKVIDKLQDQRALAGQHRSQMLVYSAVAGKYDKRTEPKRNGSSGRFVFFGDGSQTPKHWLFTTFDYYNIDPVRTAKKPKILPHVYFYDSEWSLWIDGNIDLLVDAEEIVEEVRLSDRLIGVFKHPERHCIYDEAQRCLARKKDDTELILRQTRRYKALGYPADNGLAECNVIVRKHTDTRVIKAMCDWWREIEGGSRRDQLSFNYIMWKNGLSYCELGGGKKNVRNDPRFSYRLHNN